MSENYFSLDEYDEQYDSKDEFYADPETDDYTPSPEDEAIETRQTEWKGSGDRAKEQHDGDSISQVAGEHENRKSVTQRTQERRHGPEGRKPSTPDDPAEW